MRSDPPFAVRVAAVALALLALLTALGGAGAVLLLVPVALLDPTLGGDWTLGVGVGIALGALWGGGVLISAVSGLGVWAGAPWARFIATGLSALALLSPLFLIGVVVLWGLWGSEEGRAWFDPLGEVLDPSEPDPVQSAGPGDREVGEGEGGDPADHGHPEPQGLEAGASAVEQPAESEREQVDARRGDPEG